MNPHKSTQLLEGPTNTVRVAYVISVVSSDGTGVGGSYRSLLALAQAIQAAGRDVKIFVLGDIFPSAYQDISLPNEFIEFRKPQDYWPNIYDRISSYRPTHIHAFDNKSYFFARLAARRLDIPCVLTRAGGPNPKHYFPYARDIVAFSEENAAHFRTLRKLRSSTIHLIPNRVLDFDLSQEKEKELRKLLDIDGSELVVLRICRVGLSYEESVRQAANLVRKLNASSIPSRLVVLGAIQDMESYERLRSINDIRVDFVTDRRFTSNASELVGLGDLVVGVGRGFMEAALHGLLMLAPVAGHSLPAFVLPSNLESLSRTNFSPRGSIPSYDEEDNFAELLRVLQSNEARSAHRAFIRQMARERFSVTEGAKRHISVYRSRQGHGRVHALDVALNFVVVLRFYAPIIIRRALAQYRSSPSPTTDN